MWRREERQNSHPSKWTNNGFWNTKKPVLWTLYQDDNNNNLHYLPTALIL